MALMKWPFWATTDIVDIGNGDPNKEDPGEIKQAAGWEIEKPLLQHMNWLQNLFGYFIRANNEIKVVNGGYQAEAGERVRSNNSIGSGSINLTTTPLDGQWIEIGPSVSNGIYLISVNAAPNAIMILGDTTCILDEVNMIYKFTWSDSLNYWVIERSGSRGDV